MSTIQVSGFGNTVTLTQELLNDCVFGFDDYLEMKRRYDEWFDSLAPEQQAAERLRVATIRALYTEPEERDDDWCADACEGL